MNPETVKGYKRIMANLLNILTEEQNVHVISMLEKLPDSLEDMRAEMAQKKNEIKIPRHWITLLRLIRYSLSLKSDLFAEYDSFVASYQTLSSKPARNVDEERLLKETGDFLYSSDEIFGDFDRLLTRLVAEMHKAMVEIHGMQLEPNEDFYRGMPDDKHQRKLDPLFKELLEINEKMTYNLRILAALMRMRKLILG